MADIYWNSKSNCFSIREKGRVVGHAHSVNAIDARFVVNKKGQQRVRETGHKTVHAFVRCNEFEILEPGAPPVMFLRQRVSYNPFEDDDFGVQNAEMVSMRVRNGKPELLI